MSENPPAPPIAIPFSRHPLAQIYDLDEAKSLAGRLYGTADVNVAPSRTDFYWEVNRAALGSIRIAAGWLPFGGCIATPSNGDQYILSLTRGGAGAAVCAGSPVTVSPGNSGMLVSPELPCSYHMSSGFAPLTITVDRAVLEDHFYKLTQVPLRRPLHFISSLDLSTGSGAGLLRLVEFIVKELEHPNGLLASPLARASLTEALLTALVTCALHDQSYLVAAPIPLVMPGCVHRAEAYMHAHAGDAITILDVAAAAEVSMRVLQAAFRQHRGSSPRDFLKERRLDLARSRLLAKNPGTAKVAAAAASAGYSHLGRFATDYRLRFGETPRETLRRSL